MNGDFLQYGAMGLLAMVLLAVGVFARNYLSRQQEREAERDKEDRQDRRDLTNSFQQLIEKDVEAKEGLQTALNQLCAETRSRQDDVATALKQLIEGQRDHERRANERHEQQMRQGEEVVQALRGLNGHT